MGERSGAPRASALHQSSFRNLRLQFNYRSQMSQLTVTHPRLAAGLLRCGHCGRKLHIAYSGENGSSGRYHCRGGHLNHGADWCIGMRIDRAVGAEVIERLQPLGVEAAIGAMEARRAETAEKLRQVELALEQARYEAGRARRQYDAVDPRRRRRRRNTSSGRALPLTRAGLPPAGSRQLRLAHNRPFAALQDRPCERAGSARKRSSAEGVGCAKDRPFREQASNARPFDLKRMFLAPK